MPENKDPIGPEGERRDAELFAEENLADGAWIPLGFGWNSPEEIKKRAREIKESIGEEARRGGDPPS